MQNWKILLVDDDPEDRMIIQDALQQMQAADTVRFEENGERALTALDKWYKEGSKPGLVVLDLNMPKMNGPQTLRALKNDERFKNIPVIIYSTSINRLEKEQCMLLGAHSYITKPVTLKECMETAAEFLNICNESLMQNQSKV